MCIRRPVVFYPRELGVGYQVHDACIVVTALDYDFSAAGPFFRFLLAAVEFFIFPHSQGGVVKLSCPSTFLRCPVFIPPVVSAERF